VRLLAALLVGAFETAIANVIGVDTVGNQRYRCGWRDVLIEQ
jgi:hypothetical protein